MANRGSAGRDSTGSAPQGPQGAMAAGSGEAATSAGDARSFLLAAMDHVAHASELTALHTALEGLAAAEQQYGYALKALGREADAEAVLGQAADHYREAAALALSLADVRRTERAVLEKQARAESAPKAR